MTTIRDLLVRLRVSADTDRLAQFDQGLSLIRRSLVALIAINAAAVGGLFAITNQVSRAGDEAAKAAEKVSTSVEDYQELAFAAARSGSEVQVLNVALKTSARTLFDAQRGSTELQASFAAIGLTDLSSISRDTTERFLQLAQAIADTEDEVVQAAVAQKVFGESGQALLPLIREGRDGINQLREEARQYGAVISEEATRASEDFQDELLNTTTAATALRNELGIALIPTFRDFLVSIRNTLLTLRPIVRSLLEATDRTIGLNNAIGALILTLGAATAALGALGVLALVGSAIPAITSLVGVVSAAAAAFGVGLVPFLLAAALGLAGLLVPLTAVIAQLAAVGLVVDDLIVFFRGGNSAFGELLDRFLEAPGILGSVVRFLRGVGSVIASATGLFQAFNLALLRLGGTALSRLVARLAALDERFGGLIASALEFLGLRGLFSTTFDDVAASIDRGASALENLAGLLDLLSASLGSLSLSSFAVPQLAAATPTGASRTTNVNVDAGGLQINTSSSAAENLALSDNFFGSILQQAQDALISTEE